MPGKKYTTRGMRAMKAREPQIVEGDKQLLCLRGPSTSLVSLEALRDLVSLFIYETKRTQSRIFFGSGC